MEVVELGAVLPVEGCVERVVDSGRVERTRDRLPSDDAVDGLADMFRLLGDPNRVKVLYALLEAGEMCVCDLAATVDASESSVSQALRLLRSAGVVSRRRAGRRVHYSLADGHVRMLLDLSAEHHSHGRR